MELLPRTMKSAIKHANYALREYRQVTAIQLVGVLISRQRPILLLIPVHPHAPIHRHPRPPRGPGIFRSDHQHRQHAGQRRRREAFQVEAGGFDGDVELGFGDAGGERDEFAGSSAAGARAASGDGVGTSTSTPGLRRLARGRRVLRGKGLLLTVDETRSNTWLPWA